MFERTYTMKDTRNHKRLRAHYLIKFQSLNGEGEPSVSNITDISPAGLKFWADQPLLEGTLLNVSVCIPPIGRNLEAVAQVLRVRRAKGETYYVAARFLKVSEMDQTDLGNFIDRLSQFLDAQRVVDSSSIVKRRILVGIA